MVSSSCGQRPRYGAIVLHAAIRAYRRLGFQPVGIMRRYERGPDGAWHDGLLMDLLSGELAQPQE
jgi:RimJ/RimL family protein N-acetyltransferase